MAQPGREQQRGCGCESLKLHDHPDGGILCPQAGDDFAQFVVDDCVDEGQAVGAVGMSGDPGLLPGREFRARLGERGGGLLLERVDLVRDRDGILLAHQGPQFSYLAFQLGDRFFEIQESMHGHFI